MVRMLMVMAVLASPVAAQDMTAANCDALIARVAAIVPVDIGGTGVDGGQCVLRDVALRVSAGGTGWRADSVSIRGDGPAGSLGETGQLTSLSLDLRGLTISPDVPRPLPAYLEGLMAYLQGIDASIGLNWDTTDQSLSLSRLLVDFPGDDALDMTARVTGVDASSLSGAMIGLARFAVTDAEIKITSRGLFGALVTAGLGPEAFADADAKKAALDRARTEATAMISQLPMTSFSLGSKSALRTLVADLSAPVGTLRIKLRSDAGIGPSGLLPYALKREPVTIEDLQPLFDGVRVDVAWPRALGQ